MIKEKETTTREIIIDLTGLEGNVFCLLGYAKRFGKQLGMDTDQILEDMMSNDYDHAVQTFDKHFGHFVTLLK
jgi:hypothetical protein